MSEGNEKSLVILGDLKSEFYEAAAKNGNAKAAHDELLYKTLELGSSPPDEYVGDALKELRENRDGSGHYGPYDDLMDCCEGNEMTAAILCRDFGYAAAKAGLRWSMRHVMASLNGLAMRTTRRMGPRSLVR